MDKKEVTSLEIRPKVADLESQLCYKLYDPVKVTLPLWASVK